MRAIDTSAGIEQLVGSALGKKRSKEFPDKSRCIVPTIVKLELLKWLVREVCEEQAELHREHKLAITDAIIYATARQRGAVCLRVTRILTVCRTPCFS